MLDIHMQNVFRLYSAVILNYGRNTAQLVTGLWDDKHSGVDGIRINFKALQADLFKQSVHMSKW